MLKSARPVTLRAEYGPFMTRQTVPTQYFLPERLSSYGSKNGRVAGKQENTQSVITDFKPHQMDLSAHIVTKEVRKQNGL